MDRTIEPLGRHQARAVLGDHPHEPGRSRHADRACLIGELRVALAVAVQSGRQHAAEHAAPWP